MKTMKWWGTSLALLVLISGCVRPPQTSVYRSPSEEHSRFASAGADPKDYSLVVATMVESMLSRDLRTERGERPMIVLGEIVNATPHNIRTRLISNKIQVDMLRAGTVRFSMATDYGRRGGESGELYQQLEFQNESGLVRPDTVQQFGNLIGADYLLYGRVENIERRAGGATQAYFSFILKLHSVLTGEVIWADEAEITKVL